MERRLLLAILLTFLVLTVYQWTVPKAPPSQTPGSSPAAAAGGTGGCSGSSGSGAQASGSTGAPAGQSASSATAVPDLPPVQTVVADTAEKTIVVENGVVRAEFSN